MDFKRLIWSVTPYFSKVLRSLDRRLSWLLWFLKTHYTWLSVILIGVAGCIWMFFMDWYCRYDRFDWWRWRTRAVRNSVFFILTLCVAKLLILKL